ncbi:hypothetical protein SPHFLASMR4Y_02591 [Sphingorhabdus sp. SMR4y]|nr:hypothetical protein SPHFLASMR4Y_02591 [Sphingorhabdus sp. SMR4y]
MQDGSRECHTCSLFGYFGNIPHSGQHRNDPPVGPGLY